MVLAGCAAPQSGPREIAGACPAAQPCPACPVCPAPPAPSVPKVEPLSAVNFEAIAGWQDGEQASAWKSLLTSCQALRSRESWREVCARASELPAPDDAAARQFFERHFTAWRAANPDGSLEGMVTGYYEPLLRGSRRKGGAFLYPLYGPPDDLLTIDLSAINPELRNLRLRGRLDGKRVVPYYSRSEIERGTAPIDGKEIVWVDDPIEAFFLQIQGSGRVELNGGGVLRVGYADQNGHPYYSIGRYLIDRGDLKQGEASMQGIKAWATANPKRTAELLDQNPSYVFFRELPALDPTLGPIGALGVPLTPGRSIAVDPRFIPLGAPVFLSTTWPNDSKPLTRLVLAQDTGGAIRGPVRADFFWGFGQEAGALAGRMRQQGNMWVLLPKGVQPGSGGR